MRATHLLAQAQQGAEAQQGGAPKSGRGALLRGARHLFPAQSCSRQLPDQLQGAAERSVGRLPALQRGPGLGGAERVLGELQLVGVAEESRGCRVAGEAQVKRGLAQGDRDLGAVFVVRKVQAAVLRRQGSDKVELVATSRQLGTTNQQWRRSPTVPRLHSGRYRSDLWYPSS